MKSASAISKKFVIKVITVSLMIPLTPFAAADNKSIPIDAAKADISTAFSRDRHGNGLTLVTDVWEKMKKNVPAGANDKLSHPMNANFIITPAAGINSFSIRTDQSLHT